MPALAKVRALAKQVACQSNLRQWGIIWKLYTDDNEGKFYRTWKSFADGDHEWVDCAKPYYSDPKICFCPVAKVPREIEAPVDARMNSAAAMKLTEAWGRFHKNDSRDSYPGMAGSYGVNDWVGDPYASKKSQTYIDRCWFKASAKQGNKIPMFLDCLWIGGFPDENDTPPPTEEPDYNNFVSQQMSRYCLNRHQGNTNAVFLDCSTGKVGLKELWTLKWHKEFNVQNQFTSRSYVWPEWMKQFKDFSNQP